MTHITIYKKNNEIVAFESKGHAGFAEAGSDIICSAISVLIFNTINSIEVLTEVDFDGTVDEKNALIEFSIKGNQTKESLVLLQSLELGLTKLAQENPKYVSIKFKEV